MIVTDRDEGLLLTIQCLGGDFGTPRLLLRNMKLVGENLQLISLGKIIGFCNI